MLEVIKQILEYEDKLCKSKNVIKPSVIIVIIITILYCLSSIDLVPEAFIHPKAFAFIDDLVVLTLGLFYVLKEFGGFATDEHKRVSKDEHTRQDTVSTEKRYAEEDINNKSSNVSINSINSNKEDNVIVGNDSSTNNTNTDTPLNNKYLDTSLLSGESASTDDVSGGIEEDEFERLYRESRERR